jgi:hypothetical protein
MARKTVSHDLLTAAQLKACGKSYCSGHQKEDADHGEPPLACPKAVNRISITPMTAQTLLKTNMRWTVANGPLRRTFTGILRRLPSRAVFEPDGVE